MLVNYCGMPRQSWRIFLGIALSLIASISFAGHFERQIDTSALIMTPNPEYGFGPGDINGTCSAITGLATISGALKYVYTWKKDVAFGVELIGDEAPISVVAIESCNMSASGESHFGAGYADPTSSCSNGMGPTWSSQTNSGLLDISGGTKIITTSNGTRASVITGFVNASGEHTYTINASPSADSSSGNGFSNAGFSYSVAIYPVTVSVSGTLALPDKSLEILPGQLATGSLSVGAPGVSWLNTTTNLDWSVTGETFRSYLANASAATLLPTGSREWKTKSPSWRWVSGGLNAVATCTRRLYYQPSGYPSATIGVSVGSQNINVIEPTSDFSISIGGDGHGQLLQTPLLLTSKPIAPPNAVTVFYQVDTPSEFVGAQGYGLFGYVQLLDNTQYKADSQVLFTSNITSSPPNYLDSVALDTAFPYTPFQFANSTQYTSVDSPFFGISDANVAAGISSLSTNLKGKGYTMFLAPGSSSQLVPIQTLQWTWAAEATKDVNGVWSQSANTTAVLAPAGTAFIHPEWTHRWIQ